MNTSKYIKITIILFIICFHQNVSAQSQDTGINMELYSRVMVLFVLGLISTVFIGLEVFGRAKYEPDIIVSNETLFISGSLIGSEHVADRKISLALKAGYYFAIALAMIYLTLILLMLSNL